MGGVDLSALPWGTLGPAGLVTMVVVLIIWGKLLPGTTVDRLLSARDQRITELSAALEAAERRAEVLSQQNAELMEIGRTAEQLMRALPAASDRAGEPG